MNPITVTISILEKNVGCTGIQTSDLVSMAERENTINQPLPFLTTYSTLSQGYQID